MDLIDRSERGRTFQSLGPTLEKSVTLMFIFCPGKTEEILILQSQGSMECRPTTYWKDKEELDCVESKKQV